MNRKRLDTIYADEVERWEGAWVDFFEEWDRLYPEVVDLSLEEIKFLDESEYEQSEAWSPTVKQWQHECGWYATPEEHAAWKQFDQDCEAWLSRYMDAEENGKIDLGVWPSDMPAAPDEHTAEGALREIARREVVSGPGQDIRRRAVAKDVLFMLFLARLARCFARANRRVKA